MYLDFRTQWISSYDPTLIYQYCIYMPRIMFGPVAYRLKMPSVDAQNTVLVLHNSPK